MSSSDRKGGLAAAIWDGLEAWLRLRPLPTTVLWLATVTCLYLASKIVLSEGHLVVDAFLRPDYGAVFYFLAVVFFVGFLASVAVVLFIVLVRVVLQTQVGYSVTMVGQRIWSVTLRRGYSRTSRLAAASPFPSRAEDVMAAEIRRNGGQLYERLIREARTRAFGRNIDPGEYKKSVIELLGGRYWTPEEIREREEAFISTLVTYHGFTRERAEKLVRKSAR